jgi:hypothetical protein
MQVASKALMECVGEIYEQEWPGHEQIPVKAQTLELLWGDLCHKINDQCTIPLSTYLSQFSEIRVRIFYFDLHFNSHNSIWFYVNLNYLILNSMALKIDSLAIR